jgi:hypothetical protein
MEATYSFFAFQCEVWVEYAQCAFGGAQPITDYHAKAAPLIDLCYAPIRFAE